MVSQQCWMDIQYIVLVPDHPIDPTQWIARCALRLREEWPRLAGADLAEVAAEIWAEDRWQLMEPEAAAVAWLRQGLPTVA
jgi:hypothetical protein